MKEKVARRSCRAQHIHFAPENMLQEDVLCSTPFTDRDRTAARSDPAKRCNGSSAKRRKHEFLDYKSDCSTSLRLLSPLKRSNRVFCLSRPCREPLDHLYSLQSSTSFAMLEPPAILRLHPSFNTVISLIANFQYLTMFLYLAVLLKLGCWVCHTAETKVHCERNKKLLTPRGEHGP